MCARCTLRLSQMDPEDGGSGGASLCLTLQLEVPGGSEYLTLAASRLLILGLFTPPQSGVSFSGWRMVNIGRPGCRRPGPPSVWGDGVSSHAPDASVRSEPFSERDAGVQRTPLRPAGRAVVWLQGTGVSASWSPRTPCTVTRCRAPRLVLRGPLRGRRWGRSRRLGPDESRADIQGRSSARSVTNHHFVP